MGKGNADFSDVLKPLGAMRIADFSLRPVERIAKIYPKVPWGEMGKEGVRGQQGPTECQGIQWGWGKAESKEA